MKTSALMISFGLLASAACLTLWGCPNPNNIGVQTYGYVQVTCLQASNNQPVSGAIVTVDGATTTQATGPNGVAVVSSPIGTSIQASCEAPGLSGSTVIPSLTVNNTQTNPLPITISMNPS